MARITDVSHRSVTRGKGTAGERVVADHEVCAMEIQRVDDNRSVFLVNYTQSPKTMGRVTTDAQVATWNISQNGQILNSMQSPRRSFSVR
ncbi:MAG: hypothetical protein ABGZ17_15850 [Planctomycetaceae bacterium]